MVLYSLMQEERGYKPWVRWEVMVILDLEFGQLLTLRKLFLIVDRQLRSKENFKRQCNDREEM